MLSFLVSAVRPASVTDNLREGCYNISGYATLLSNRYFEDIFYQVSSAFDTPHYCSYVLISIFLFHTIFSTMNKTSYAFTN